MCEKAGALLFLMFAVFHIIKKKKVSPGKKKGQPLCQCIDRTLFHQLYTQVSRLCEEQAEDTFSVPLFVVDAVIMTPGPVLVDLVAVSSGSYPAAPDSVQPDSDNLRQGLLQQHLWIL